MPRQESEIKSLVLSEFTHEKIKEKKALIFDFGEKDEKIK